jgi:SAM-dependent methyltransferase
MTSSDGGQSPFPSDYFDAYAQGESYDDIFEDLFDAQYTVDLIQAVWCVAPPFRLLDCGSANGLTLQEFAKVGVEAWGIENHAGIHAQTDAAWRERNLLGDIRKLPFPDASFDFIYDTALPYLPEDQVDLALREMFRVCRRGIFLSGEVADMTPEVIEEYELFEGVQTLWTARQWADAMVRNGFERAVRSAEATARLWQVEQACDPDGWDWYPNAETMALCFFSRPS